MIIAPRSNAQRYLLKNDAEEYLHGSATVMTKDINYAWTGTAAQKAALIKQHPKLAKLQTVALIGHTKRTYSA